MWRYKSFWFEKSNHILVEYVGEMFAEQISTMIDVWLKNGVIAQKESITLRNRTDLFYVYWVQMINSEIVIMWLDLYQINWILFLYQFYIFLVQ